MIAAGLHAAATVVTPGSGLLGLAAAGISAVLALMFVQTARWPLALVAAAVAAVATGFENGVLPMIVVAGLGAGVAAGFSSRWCRAERLCAQRNRDVLPASHRERLAGAAWWYPQRVAAAALTVVFPAVVVVTCFAVAHWSWHHVA